MKSFCLTTETLDEDLKYVILLLLLNTTTTAATVFTCSRGSNEPLPSLLVDYTFCQ